MGLTQDQRELLSWANGVPLVRWTDGMWRGLGSQLGDDEFEQEDVRLLAKMGMLELMPVGAIITEAGRLALNT